ncbi:hypothetical protein GTY74_30335 [Streptomyces sp. SID8350]|nr:hypothetical protein [Streptomyces sp. SID8350]
MVLVDLLRQDRNPGIRDSTKRRAAHSRSFPAETLTTLRHSNSEHTHTAVTALGLFDQAAQALGQPGLHWNTKRCELTAGAYLSPHYDPADVQAYLILDRTEETPHEESGTFVFSDPRAGIQNVFVPGMPWNKSVSVRAEPGRFFAAPGWLATMVTPLAEGEHLSWLHLQGSRY